MGYYMRYLFEGEPEVKLDALEAALKRLMMGMLWLIGTMTAGVRRFGIGMRFTGHLIWSLSKVRMMRYRK